jgi:hypothetical protein
MSTICVYIPSDLVEDYLSQGWEVSMFGGHHSRFALATIEWLV